MTDHSIGCSNFSLEFKSETLGTYCNDTDKCLKE